MTKKFKALSLIERLNNPIYRLRTYARKIEQYVHVKKDSFDETTGRLCSKLELIKKDNKSLAHFKVSDFYLENLQVSGAINNLGNTSLTRDNLTTISNLERTANNIVESSNQSN